MKGKRASLLPSLRVNGSRECAPDDRLREAIRAFRRGRHGLLRRFAPRKKVSSIPEPDTVRTGTQFHPIRVGISTLVPTRNDGGENINNARTPPGGTPAA